MARDAGRLEQGQIVWAEVLDRAGNPKKRPLVIVTSTDEIVLDTPIVAVAISTTFPDPAPDDHVELPWHSRAHPATRLARRSAAVCTWLVELRSSDIKEVKGFVPTATLLEVLKRLPKAK
jgi:mRNA-degrading endonuclease toxin of MazEF toxin-antitoxin module